MLVTATYKIWLKFGDVSNSRDFDFEIRKIMGQ